MDVTPFFFDFKRLSAVFENHSHTTLTVDVQGFLRLKAGLPAWFPQAGGPAFLFSPRFSARDCVKVSGGFLYKFPNNMGRSQRFPFQGGSAPFCGAGFVKQNLGWELAPSASTLASPPLRTSPPKYLPAGKKKFCLAPPRKPLISKKPSAFHTWVISCESAAFSFSAGKTLRAKGTRPRDGPNKPLFPPMGKRPHESTKPPLLAQCGPFLAIQPHKLTHPPQALDFSSRLGLFYFQRKEGCLALGPWPHKKIKKE